MASRHVDTPAPVDAAMHTDGGQWRQRYTKAPFLVLCWLSFVVLMGIGAAGLYLMWPRLVQLPPFQYIMLGAVGLFFAILGAGLLLITITVITGIDLLYPHNKPSVTVSLLFPLAIQLGKLFRMSRSRLMVSYIKVNNAMTIAQRHRIHARKILVLLPHCLQIDKCDRNITHTIDNCRRCGRCPVDKLLSLREKYDIPIEVVNGGTLARKKVKTFRPDAIVAVACERDLTSGINAVYPIPVFGVINDRPYGPCVNTNVDIGLVEQGIRFFKGYDHHDDDTPGAGMQKLRESAFVAWMWRLRIPFYCCMRRLWPFSRLVKQENDNARQLITSCRVSLSGRIADVGCGFGNGLNLVSCNGNYLGLDKCYPLIKKAASSLHHTFITGDGNLPPLKSETFDMIIATGVLEYQRDQWLFLEALASIVRPGGYVLLTSSPPGILTAMRQLQGIPLRPLNPGMLKGKAQECGLALCDEKRTLMQQQFLFVRRDRQVPVG
jgi:hypothetical protein